MKPKYSRLFATTATLIVATFAAPSAFATSDAWDGSTDGVWATTTNWLTDPALVPGAGETATFNAASANTTINLGAGVTIGSILFDTASASAYTLGSGAVGSQTLTLGTVGNAITMNSAVANNQLVNANLALSTTGTYTVTNQSTTNGLTIAGGISASSAGTKILSVAGSGNTAISGAITAGSGGMNLLKTGTGTLTLSGGGGFAAGTVAGYGNANMSAELFGGITRISSGTYTSTGSFTVGGVQTDGSAGVDTNFTMDGGSLTTSDWFGIGRGNGVGAVTSSVVLNNAATVTVPNFSAGYNNNSTLNLPKGTFTLNNTSSFTVTGNGAFNFAENTGSNMTMTLNDSSQVTAAGTAVKYIGQSGTGTLNINGTSSVSFGNAITYVGYQTGTGNFSMAGGTFSNTGEVRVGGSNTNGAFTGGSGTMTFTGGTATVGTLTLARGNDATGAMNGNVNIGGSALITSEGDVTMGFNGAGCLGKIVVSGGTLNIATATKRWMLVSRSGTANGQLDVNGGNVNLNTNTDIRYSTLAAAVGTNVINLNNGAITSYSGNQTGDGAGVVDLQQGTGTTSNNTFNLNGGTLAIREVMTNVNTNTAAFNFNGGTLKATGNTANFVNLGGGTQTANIKTGGAIINSNGYDVTIPQALLDGSGGGGLTKQGGGNLTLNAANTYTGATNINGGGTLTIASGGSINNTSGVNLNSGTFNARGALAGVTVADDAANTLTSPSGAVLTLGSLAFGGDAVANVNMNGVAGIAVTGALSTTPANGTVTLNISNSSPWALGDNPVISSGSFGGSATDFTLGSVSPGVSSRQTITGLVTTASGVALHVGGDAPVWTGLASGQWTTNTIGGAGNWKLQIGGTVTDFLTDDDVLFNDTASSGGTHNVVINDNTVSPHSTTFNTALSNYILSSTTGDGIYTGLFVKNGAGTVTILNSNQFTDTTTINGGTLQIGDGTTDGEIPNSDIIDNASLTYKLAGNLTQGTIISGTGTVTKSGAGTLVLSGINTYSGGTTINAGTLQLTQTAGAAAAGVYNLNGSRLEYNTSANNFGLGNTINLLADSSIGNIGTAQINQTGTVTGNSHALNFDAPTGNVRLYLNSAVSGLTQINILSGAMGFDLGVGNHGGSAPVVVSDGAALWIANATNTLDNHITLIGTGQSGLGALFMEGAGTPTISGTVTLAGATSIGGNNGGGAVKVTGLVEGSGSTLTKIGANIYALSNTNTFSGGLNINAGTIACASAAGTNGNLGTAAVTVNAGGILRPGYAVTSNANFSTTPNSITLAGGSIYADDAFQHLSGTLDVTTGGTLGATYNSGNNGAAEQDKGLFIDGVVSGAGALTLQQSGINTTHTYNTSIVHFTNNSNTYSGTITINPMTGTNGGSYLGLSGSTALQYATVNLNGNNTSSAQQFGTSPVVFKSGLGTANIGALSGTGNVVLTGYDETNHVYGVDAIALNVGGNNATTSFAGSISGGGSLTKTGAGAFTLSGANTYTGTTSVNAGTLALTGTLSGTAVTVSNSGTALSVTGAGTMGASLTVNSGAHLAMAVADTAGNQPARTVSGTVTLNSASVLDLTAVATPAVGVYTLLSAGSVTGLPSTVNLPALPSGTSGVVSIVGGNSLVLTVAVSGYANWAATNAPSGTANDDYDNDGVSNGAEYLLGGLASTNDADKLPKASTSGGNLVVTFKRKQTSETPDVTAKIEVGTTLASWPTSFAVPNDPVAPPVNPGVSVVDNLDGTDTITLTIAQAPDAKKFARLVVTITP